MDKKRIVFIVNPISGTQNKSGVQAAIRKYIDRDKFEMELAQTEYAGHASVLAKTYAEQGFDAVIAVGGDGTVNEIARALVHHDTALGIIPCGSGNGMARHLHIPMEVQGALEVINRFAQNRLDYGTINGHPFFCTCGVGFDAFVSFKFAASEKRGILTYLENTLLEGLKYKPETYEIEIEGETSKYKAFLITCANASQYGNNAYIAPDASMSDGLMDVTIMEPFTVLEAPQIAIQLFSGTLPRNSRIKTFRCSHLSIHREHDGVIHYDGDPIMEGREIDVRLIERGLNVIINDAGPQDVRLGKWMSALYEEMVRFGMNVHTRNLRRINELNKEVMALNKEVMKRLKR